MQYGTNVYMNNCVLQFVDNYKSFQASILKISYSEEILFITVTY
jgi:hypothetical protein